ncbi:MAG: hypothetical protein JSW10_03035 [Pseudomonadota bacterium]|nr:MAG: hypothetical protein JSW10_03035 [Pseudomonadota bacterium]
MVEPEPLEAPSGVEDAEVAPMEPPTEAAIEAPVPPQPEPEGGIMDTVFGVLGGITAFVAGIVTALVSSPLLLAAVGVGVIVLVLLLVLLRRRRAAEPQSAESILMGAPGPSTEEESIGTPAATEGGRSQEESSFLSDFAISGMNAIQTEDTEVDPLTEADVFMAYGRYEAAEERLTDAIKSEPARKELKLKLIELYYTTKNKASFEAAAAELYAALGDGAASDPMWGKVTGMGAELASDNPMFGGTGAPAATPPAAAAPAPSESGTMSTSEIMDIGLDTGVFQATEPGPATAEAAPGGISEELDFSLDTAAGGGEATTQVDLEAGDMAAQQSSEALDFNLDLGDIETPAEKTEPASAEGGDLSFDLGELSIDTGADTGTEEQDEGALDFDLDLGGGAAETEDEAGQHTTQVNLGSPLDLESTADLSQELDLGGGDMGSIDEASVSDEVGTKLDLAKAYIDMGDPDGARSILDEVLAEGDTSQKQEAEQLLQQIA